MTTQSQQAQWDAAVAASTRPDTTPFDYIIVGSGAGGGPLAARLALSGRRVLLVEAGRDPAADNPNKEIYDIPAYNGAATEDAVTSWDFSVRHFDDDRRQQADTKYSSAKDPSQGGGVGKGGIFYPRAAALGGCTSHHAMIIIRPNDADWDEMARLTGDDSWRSENMQGYFPRIEQCLYYAVYKGFLGSILGGILSAVQWIATAINPRLHLDPNGHGLKGWQPTSFIDPLVIAGIARGDRTFLGLLFNVIWSALATKGSFGVFKRALSHLQIVQFLDPNVRADYARYLQDRARLSLISIGTDGKRRTGLREWLLEVAEEHPDRLVLRTGEHVTRVIFASDAADPAPRAVGVEVARGEYLYRASKAPKALPADRVQYFARREVIVCGGSFNSPQLLMLSGIGDATKLNALSILGPRDSEGNQIVQPIDLPGVGRNLQDRYEVSVISQMKSDFSTLKDASFTPGDLSDPMRTQWLADQTGLYATNGGALAMMMSSTVNARDNPDLFVFGVPAAFRGYYWNWSNELLWRTKGAGLDQRNLWSWVILKAYTDNNRGTVTLRSADPFDVPEINFHSFDPDQEAVVPDATALCDAIKNVREINGKITGMELEIQPGANLQDGSAALLKWVQDEAWGHHACGTCRIGRDSWQSDVTALSDGQAVLDSQFRVHGVRSLRVVDASVFPRIPGYFIVTPVFMIAEKAADTILADSPSYPSEVEQIEAAAVHQRRAIGQVRNPATPVPTTLPEDCVGIALSGGGVRSATYGLGVLQALAGANLLRRIDFLSTVSGGGYIGGFLGRLYTNLSGVADPAARVEATLTDPNSPEIWWLRRYADYLGGAGRSDFETALAIFARNILSVYICIAALFLAVLGALRWLADRMWPEALTDWTVLGYYVSPWWTVSAAVLILAVLPLAASYWLTPGARSRWQYPLFGLLVWVVFLGGAIAALSVPGGTRWSLIAIGVLLLAWLWQEAVRWPTQSVARPPSTGQTGRPHAGFATLYRNRLARTLGSFLFLFAASVGFVVIDTLARSAATGRVAPVMGGALLIASPLLPFLRNLVVALVPGRAAEATEQVGLGAGKIALDIFAFALATLLFFAIDVVAHAAFEKDYAIGMWMVLAAAAASVALGQALNFLNLSSLQQTLTQKLARTFLGASNDARVYPIGTEAPVPINVSDEGDDLSLANYHPERQGGPLHLINVCVNQTVDHISGRQLSNNKGLPMCLGPSGIGVGRQYHAIWEERTKDLPENKASVRALPVAPDPHLFHVLGQRDSDSTTVEQLSLGRWLAISAAALSTGAGRRGSLPLSLLLGLLNVRLGYWWNSGINPGNRPGRYPPNLWRRTKSLPSTVFAVQAMLLNEWRGYFEGPSARRWYLSDGGHFENTGLYELIRRRLPFMIAVDAEQDGQYQLGDLAILMRQVRLDFCAEINWLDPAASATGWGALDAAAAPATIPGWIKQLIKRPQVIGGLKSLGRDGPSCATLARISYADQPDKESWLLLIKPSLGPMIRADVRNYALSHPSFPNESTVDQFFDDAQWESYRSLGESAGKAIFG